MPAIIPHLSISPKHEICPKKSKFVTLLTKLLNMSESNCQLISKIQNLLPAAGTSRVSSGQAANSPSSSLLPTLRAKATPPPSFVYSVQLLNLKLQ